MYTIITRQTSALIASSFQNMIFTFMLYFFHSGELPCQFWMQTTYTFPPILWRGESRMSESNKGKLWVAKIVGTIGYVPFSLPVLVTSVAKPLHGPSYSFVWFMDGTPFFPGSTMYASDYSFTCSFDKHSFDPLSFWAWATTSYYTTTEVFDEQKKEKLKKIPVVILSPCLCERKCVYDEKNRRNKWMSSECIERMLIFTSFIRSVC